VRELMESMRNWLDFRLRHLQALLDANIGYASLRRATDLDRGNIQHWIGGAS
jgi:hypothetical protein